MVPHQYMTSSRDKIPLHQQPKATLQQQAIIMSSLGEPIQKTPATVNGVLILSLFLVDTHISHEASLSCATLRCLKRAHRKSDPACYNVLWPESDTNNGKQY